MDPETTRLNKYLAFELGISRREADEYIEKGRISINGAPASLGSRVHKTDKVLLDTMPLTPRATPQYIALNKPVGYICSRRRQGDTPTIFELLPEQLRQLKPVGRLDKDSSGLLLLTNDGDFAHRMTHPRFQKTKVYTATLNAPLAPLHQQMMSDFGVQLEDGPSRLQLERLNDERTQWRVTMHEGRNRQIRRTFASLGYTVIMLHRSVFGPYRLGSLPSGSFQAVTKQ